MWVRAGPIFFPETGSLDSGGVLAEGYKIIGNLLIVNGKLESDAVVVSVRRANVPGVLVGNHNQPPSIRHLQQLRGTA